MSDVIDKDAQDKIDIVKQRRIRTDGCNEESAAVELNSVASIFARADTKA